MKKKVLYGVFMALMSVFAMGTLQSCTDDLSDFEHQYAYDQYNLGETIDRLQATIDANKATCESEIARLEDKIATNTGDIATLRNDLEALSGEIVSLEAFNNLQKELDKLKEDLDNLNTDYDEIKGEITEEIKGELEDVQGDVAAIGNRIDGLDADYQAQFSNLGNELQTAVTEMTDNYGELSGKVDGIISDYNTLSSTVNGIVGDLTEINTKLDGLANVNDELEQLKKDIKANSDRLDGIDTEIGGINDKITKIETAITDFQTEINDLKKKYDDALAAVNEDLTKIYNKLAAHESYMEDLLYMINNNYTELNEQISTLRDAIESLEDKYIELTLRLNSLVTSILLQSTANPIFGNFSLPIGVQTNMLFNWYAFNSNPEFTFPSVSKTTTYDGEASSFTSDDKAFLQPETFEVANGYFLDNVNLGRLYLTINPVGNFNYRDPNVNFSLETTGGKALPYTMSVAPSDEDLYWGWSRSASNGFYSADVLMPGNSTAVDASRVEIEAGLKTAVKDILKDRSKRNALNLLKAVYDQVSDMLPRYAVRYDRYNQDRTTSTVLSNYDLAVATAKPLSYSFMEGESIDHKIRTFGHIENFIRDLVDKDKFKFDFTFDDFHIDRFNITFEDLTFDFKINPSVVFNDKIVVTAHTDPQDVDVSLEDQETHNIVSGTVTIPGQDVTVEITGDDMTPLIDAIMQGIQDSMSEMSADLGDQINNQIRDKLLKGIQDEVNKMLDNIQGQITDLLNNLSDQINGQICDMIEDVMQTIESKTDPIFDRVNKVIDLYNRVANKINSMLENPNHYLQPVILYKNNGGVGILSNVKGDPTLLVKAGGNAFSFYLTSYSAEIVAPAAKKYVAVSNVYDKDGNSVLSAHSDEVKAINSASANLNKVLEGNTIRAAVATSQMKEGLTYEIVYQGLDYSGKTSTQKFYIKVK